MATAGSASRAGALQDWYRSLLARGMREELARVTLAQKLAALTLHLWRTGERYNPEKLTVQAQSSVRPVGRDLSRPSLR